MASSFPGALDCRPFEVHVADEAIAEFKQLLRLSKIGPATFENTTSAGPGVGLSRDWTEKTREYWLSKYDWYYPSTMSSMQLCLCV